MTTDLDRTEDEMVLDVPEAARLARLEIVIEDGLATFVKVGGALLAIRSERLYREAHDTFDDYCQERWNFSKQYAHLVIAEAEVNQLVDGPLRQSHARELVPLLGEPERLRETWAEVVELHPEPTAANVREVVQRRLDTTATLGSSESDEWYTPAEYVEAARRVLGAIDLDPASCDAANEVVQAARFFTLDSDGLAQEWHGRVFMNPPFGRDGSPRFVEKLLAEHRAGRVQAAILVCAARLETQWFQPLFDHLLCFPDHRVRFWQPGRVPAPPFTPAFAYLGGDDDSFTREFSRFGPVVRRVHGRAA